MALDYFATQAGSYSAETTRRAMFAAFARTAANTPGIIAGGLLSSADLQITAPSSGMTVNIGIGEGIIGGSEGGAQGGYYFRNSSSFSAPVSAANPSNPRIDAVVATMADAGYTQPSDVGSTANGPVFAVVTGTPTAGATLSNLNGAPSIPLSSLLLGYVLAPAAATSIVTADIANVAKLLSIGVDTGWVLLTLGTGIITASADFLPAARLLGTMVFLRGGLFNNSGSSISSGTTLATVGAQFIPAGLVTVTAAAYPGGTAAGLQISSATGAMTYGSALANGSAAALDGVSYSHSV